MAGNEISIRTDRGTYVGGDTIYGSVYLCIKQAIPSHILRLHLRGYEISEFDYQYVQQQGEDTFMPKVGQRKAKKDVVRADMKLVEYPGGFPVGYYCYPFQYQLPHNLPGVFHCRHEDMDSGRVWEAVVKYTVGASLDSTDLLPEHRLSGETPLIVYDSLDCRNAHIAPDKQSASGTVRTFFCIHRGDVHLSSRLDHSAYLPDSEITVQVDINNQSAVDVIGATVKLIRVIKLLGLDKTRSEEQHSSNTIYDTVMEMHPNGCSKNNTTSSKVVFDLSQFSNETQAGVPPTTSGSLVKCNYVIDVDVHVPWAPDIEVRQPLIIKPSPNVVWEKWTPPPWVNECVQAPVTGMCSVPPDILTSQSFSGIPGFQPLL